MSEIRKRFLSMLTRWRKPSSPWQAASPSSPADPEAALAASLGLKPVDLSNLKRLTSLPEWASYLGLLERLYERHALALKSGLTFEKYHQEIGSLVAFEQMATYADQVALKLEEVHDHAQRIKRPEPDRRSILADSHWATPVS